MHSLLDLRASNIGANFLGFSAPASSAARARERARGARAAPDRRHRLCRRLLDTVSEQTESSYMTQLLDEEVPGFKLLVHHPRQQWQTCPAVSEMLLRLSAVCFARVHDPQL